MQAKAEIFRLSESEYLAHADSAHADVAPSLSERSLSERSPNLLIFNVSPEVGQR